MKQPYSDIIEAERRISTRAHMTNYNRAAQFAPFAALSGFGDCISETARLTDRKIQLDEEEREKLDRRLIEIIGRIDDTPLIRITYFIPDPRKAGGKYITVDRRLKKIDNIYRKMIFTDGTQVNADDVLSIESVSDNEVSEGQAYEKGNL